MFGMPFSMIALIGIILLIGIVKKNAIMMIDVAIQSGTQRRHERPAKEAIHEAAVVRLRPIMMTTAAAVLGAVPLAIGIGQGASLRQPLGITVMGGLLAEPGLHALHDAGDLSLPRSAARASREVVRAPAVESPPRSTGYERIMKTISHTRWPPPRWRCSTCVAGRLHGRPRLSPSRRCRRPPRGRNCPAGPRRSPPPMARRATGGPGFNDPLLNELEPLVSVSNQTVRQDYANYQEALAEVRLARSALFPTIGVTGSVTRSRSATGNFSNSSLGGSGRGNFHAHQQRGFARSQRELGARLVGRGAPQHRIECRHRPGQRSDACQRDAWPSRSRWPTRSSTCA